MSACVEERPWLNRVRCGVVERGGVLERELLGVPPMGEVKSDGPAAGGIWSTGGVGMKLAYCHCDVLGLWKGIQGAVCGLLQWRSVPCALGGWWSAWEETVLESGVFWEVEERVE